MESLELPKPLTSFLEPPSLERDGAPHIFLLYNSQEPGVGDLVGALRAQGLSVWYSVDSLLAGEDWDQRETRALREASTAVVVLGRKGWGRYQQSFAERAIELAKHVIPIVLGDTDAGAFGIADGIFHKLKRVHFESPHDTRALAEVVSAVRAVLSRGGPKQNGERTRDSSRRRAIDPAPVLAQLLGSSADARETMLDELEVLDKRVDRTPLWQAFLERWTSVEPSSAGDEHAPQRAALVAGLILTGWKGAGSDLPSEQRAIAEAVKAEPNPIVRFAGLSAAWRAQRSEMEGVGAEGIPKGESDPAVRWLWETICWRGHADHIPWLGTALADATTTDRVLDALGVVAIPELIPNLLERAALAPDERVFRALTHRELTQALVAALAHTEQLPALLASACKVAESAGSYVVKRMQRLLAALPPAEVHSLLAQHVASNAPGSAAGARRLLGGLDVPNRFPVAGFRSDGGKDTPDDLRVGVDVQTLCAVILARDVEPPLSIGLFGDWGTGKSFFMDRMWNRVVSMGEEVAALGYGSRFHTRVAQIRFNAWHYIDANLWASLVSHIIEELAKAVAPEQDLAVVRRTLVAKLETAKQLKEDVQHEHDRALAAKRAAEDALSRVARDRAARQVSLADLRARDLWQVVAKDPNLARSLESVEALGVSKVFASADELGAALTEAHTLAGRARAVLLELPKQTSAGSVFVLVALLVVLVPVAAFLLDMVLREQSFSVALSAACTEIAALLVAARHMLKGPLATAKASLDKLSRAKQQVVELLERERQKRSTEEIELERDVNELRAKEQSASQQLRDADTKIQEIQDRLREIEEGRSLTKYLLERMQSDDYRRHLGIVSTIRRDFERLATLLGSTAADRNTQPIERIVLYIDDLDRCSPERVLEVLQAVHLLMAFKLFVVVVGVDPRWLLHALEESYSAFRAAGRARGREWRTTPQNYLEKIFQIPFYLKAMEPDGFGRLMATLLPITSAKAEARVEAPRAATPAKPPAGSNGSPSKHGHAAAPDTAASVLPSPPAIASSNGSPQPPAASPAPRPTSSVAAIPALDFQALEISSHEQQFAIRLHEFIPTPRAANRVTNIYRLLKARVSHTELPAFEGSTAAPGEFKAVLFLLALMTRFPDSAATVFAALRGGAPNHSTSDHFADAARAGLVETDIPIFERCASRLLTELPETLEPFLKWIPHVARFSFNAERSSSTRKPRRRRERAARGDEA